MLHGHVEAEYRRSGQPASTTRLAADTELPLDQDKPMANFGGIEHIALTVPDHAAAVRFMEEAFGATVLYSIVSPDEAPLTAEDVGHINGLLPGTKMVAASQMRFANGPNIELFQLEGYRRSEAAGINDVGLVHFSVLVEDIVAASERFRRAGGRLMDGPNDLGHQEAGAGNRNWFGQMPWGTWVEFMTFAAPIRYDADAVSTRWFPRAP
jgi:catechol 2,3-dioxygenase-like lactoylglutathione lyase family enzyme